MEEYLTFEDVCNVCIANYELVKQFNRLTGLHLGENRSPIIRKIDESCGYDPDKETLPVFIKFVYTCVWLPLCHDAETND